MIHKNILSAIGNTPLVTINRLNTNPAVKILAKIESCNPGGSIKDRVAAHMIRAAEKAGELTPDKTIIEATSGNTGIGLAMVCAVKGYKLKLLMPETASAERRKTMRAYGADIVLTPGHLSTDGAIEEAYRMAREEPEKYVLMDQYNNPASIDAHYQATGQEIWDQTNGTVTHVVGTLGTTGTMMGTTKRIKELSADVQMIAVEPNAGHKIQGLKNMQESYPPGIYNKKSVDRIVRVEDETAFETTRRLAREEGLFSGMSSGAAMAAAIDLAQELTQGTIVVLLPDSGERYLSTTLFASQENQGVRVDSLPGDKEVFLTQSTDGMGFFTVGPALDMLEDVDAWRRIALLDALGAYVVSRGGKAKIVVGLADMDDRAIQAARDKNISCVQFTEQALEQLRQRARGLGVSDNVEFFPASKCVDTCLELCRALLAKGAAYEKLRSVYFDVKRSETYGQLGVMNLDNLDLGKTVDLDDYVKANPMDFTLLKRASLQDLKTGDCLQTEWGNVRPSWFLQMAAVALDHLPEMTVFMAGQSHKFPHLENMHAIWSLGRRRVPQAWMVCDNVKAAEADSLPLDAFDDAGFRMWLLSTTHHKTLRYSENSLAMWRKNWINLQHFSEMLSKAAAGAKQGKKAKLNLHPDVDQALADLKSGFKNAMESDMGLHRLWPALFKFNRAISKLHASSALPPESAATCLNQLSAIDDVLRFLDRDRITQAASGEENTAPSSVLELVNKREQARTAKDYALADTLRAQITAAGYTVEDTAAGPRVHVSN